MAEHGRSLQRAMKRCRRKSSAGGVSIERMEERLLLSGVVTGTVFYDLNWNLLQDAGEASAVGVTIYDDVNRNGKLDAGEVATTSDEAGSYSLLTDEFPSRLAIKRP